MGLFQMSPEGGHGEISLPLLGTGQKVQGKELLCMPFAGICEKRGLLDPNPERKPFWGPCGFALAFLLREWALAPSRRGTGNKPCE